MYKILITETFFLQVENKILNLNILKQAISNMKAAVQFYHLGSVTVITSFMNFEIQLQNLFYQCVIFLSFTDYTGMFKIMLAIKVQNTL